MYTSDWGFYGTCYCGNPCIQLWGKVMIAQTQWNMFPFNMERRNIYTVMYLYCPICVYDMKKICVRSIMQL